MKRANNSSQAFRVPAAKRSRTTPVVVTTMNKDQVQDEEIKRLKSQVRKLTKQPEVKHRMFAYTSIPLPFFNKFTGYIGLSAIPNGTADNERIGNQIRARRLKIRLSFANTNQTPVRIIIFNDKQHGGATSIAAESISTSSNNFALLNDAGQGNAFPIQDQVHNHDMSFRYHVYRDVVFDYRNNTQSGTRLHYQFDVLLNDLLVGYAGSGGGITDVVSNMLQVAVITTANTGTPLSPSIQAELEYTDA